MLSCTFDTQASERLQHNELDLKSIATIMRWDQSSSTFEIIDYSSSDSKNAQINRKSFVSLVLGKHVSFDGTC